MGDNRKNSGFLKECMADALIKLMKTKDYSKITIKEIAQTAGVNRSTWFRNFDEKSEALSYKLVKLWYKYGEECGFDENTEYTIDNSLHFFTFNYQNRELIELIYKENLEIVIYEAFYQIMNPQFAADATEHYENRFFAHGMFGMLIEWQKRDYKESPKEMSEKFLTFIGKK